jgi:hypothetical protein
MSEPDVVLSPSKPRRRWRRLLVVLIAVPCLLLVAYGGARLVGHLQVRAAIADADRLDPGWRSHDLEDQRTAVPDQENSAFVVLTASSSLPSPWPSLPPGMDEFVDYRVRKVPSEKQLDSALLKELRAELAAAAPALLHARRLADMPQGRYRITRDRSNMFLGTHRLTDSSQIANLLSLEAALLAQENRMDEAMAAGRGVLNAGRSVGDEPLAVSQLSRLMCRGGAVDSLQRTLAQGQPSLSELATTQELLADEEAYPWLLVALRGERAWMHDVMEAGIWGQPAVPPKPLNIVEFFSNLFSGNSQGASESTKIDWVNDLAPEFAQAKHLRHMNACIQLAQLPEADILAEFDRLELDLPDPDTFKRYAMLPMRRFARAHLRYRALLRSAIAALAAERYRQANGRWPDSLATLVEAKLLREVPLDPFDGAALRFQRLNDGLVIYSISLDREDNGGKLDRSGGLEPGTDAGFRLWDVAHRRQPPLPPTPKQDPE